MLKTCDIFIHFSRHDLNGVGPKKQAKKQPKWRTNDWDIGHKLHTLLCSERMGEGLRAPLSIYLPLF